MANLSPPSPPPPPPPNHPHPPDSDSDSDTEAEQSSQLQTLESELSRNPANYDAHVQYIQLLRKMGEIEKLRQAREAMSQIFPLTPQMWQEWAKDELTMSTGSEAVPKIEKLYERGVSDYLRASDYLSPQIKGTEALLRLHAYWACLELILANDIIAARGVWESLLKISATMLEAWQGYINMEIEKGNLNEARSIYRRCYGKRFPGSGSEDICQSWLRFEREFGTLEDYDTATMKVSARLEELLLFRLKQESKTVATSSEVKEHPSKTGAREKRKLAPNKYEDQTPSKRQKDNNDSATKVVKKTGKRAKC